MQLLLSVVILGLAVWFFCPRMRGILAGIAPPDRSRPFAARLMFNHVNFRFPWPASFVCLGNRWGAIKCRGVGGGVGVVGDGGCELMSGLVTGRTEKRLVTGTIDPRREEAGGIRGTSGCRDMRWFSKEGGDRDARDSRREAR
jgi:hypothetical protein